MKVYVTRKIPEEGIWKLRQAGAEVEVNPHDRDLTPEEFRKAIQGFDAVLCMLTNPVDRETLETAPGVRVFANYAVGYNNCDLKAATEKGVFITNTPDVLTAATADLAWTLLFAAARKVVPADRFTRQGFFYGWAPELFLGQDITGATLGVVGAGRIGTAMALRSRGFEMKVLYSHPRENPVLEKEVHARQISLDELLEQSDYVSLHVPLTPETHHLIGKNELAGMKSGSVLINTARGPVVDEGALVEALKKGPLAGAGLDVFEKEPELYPGLKELGNVVVLPHIGSATTATRSRMSEMTAENILAGLSGKKPPHLVNETVWQG